MSTGRERRYAYTYAPYIYERLQLAYRELTDKGGLTPRDLEFPGWYVPGLIPGYERDQGELQGVGHMHYNLSAGRLPTLVYQEYSSRPMIDEYVEVIRRYNEFSCPTTLSAEDIRYILGK